MVRTIRVMVLSAVAAVAVASTSEAAFRRPTLFPQIRNGYAGCGWHRGCGYGGWRGGCGYGGWYGAGWAGYPGWCGGCGYGAGWGWSGCGYPWSRGNYVLYNRGDATSIGVASGLAGGSIGRSTAVPCSEPDRIYLRCGASGSLVPISSSKIKGLSCAIISLPVGCSRR